MLHFLLVQNRAGKTRLSKWYSPFEENDKQKLSAEIHRIVNTRESKFANWVEFRTWKIVYKRYAGLFFCAAIDPTDNELIHLEAIQLFVEILDTYFGNVCELDLVFYFNKVFVILDEVILAGEVMETSRRLVLDRMEQMDMMP